MLYLEYFDRIIVEEVNELGQQLDAHYELTSWVARVNVFQNYVINFVIAYLDQR
jgi:hypothetical protein